MPGGVVPADDDDAAVDADDGAYRSLSARVVITSSGYRRSSARPDIQRPVDKARRRDDLIITTRAWYRAAASSVHLRTQADYHSAQEVIFSILGAGGAFAVSPACRPTTTPTPYFAAFSSAMTAQQIAAIFHRQRPFPPWRLQVSRRTNARLRRTRPATPAAMTTAMTRRPRPRRAGGAPLAPAAASLTRTTSPMSPVRVVIAATIVGLVTGSSAWAAASSSSRRWCSPSASTCRRGGRVSAGDRHQLRLGATVPAGTHASIGTPC